MENRNLKAFKNLVFFAGFIALLLACNYYRPVRKANYVNNPKVFDSLMQKTFIVHSNRGIFMLSSMQLFPERETIEGILSEVSENHKMYLNDKTKKYRYYKKAPYVLEEVHIYTRLDSSVRINNPVSITFRDITKLEVIERDKGKSTGTTVLAVMGITIGTMAVISAIAVALKESCPFISVYDGNEYVLQGETFGGAIYPSLAREDIVPLPSAAIGAEVKVMVSNELKERQFTDVANLLLAEHEPGQQVLSTTKGNLMLVGQTYAPQTATLNYGRDMITLVSETDNLPCAFNDTTDPSAVNRLVLKFLNPRGGKKLGLQLTTRNSSWLEYTFQEFTKHFGGAYQTWQEKQREKPAEEIMGWKESQHFNLSVSVKTKDGWKLIQQINTIGPLMNRDLAIPLEDLPEAEDTIEIAFSTGFMFWEVDCVKLAEMEPLPAASFRYLKPIAAVDEEGHSVMQQVQEMDGKFLEQPVPGKRAYLTYKVPGYSPTKAYSAFLHASGYYEPVRDYSGPADVGFLNRMKQPGAFTAYSMEEYRRVTHLANLASLK